MDQIDSPSSDEGQPSKGRHIQISYAGQRLLYAVDAPPGLDGGVLAARKVRNCVLQAIQQDRRHISDDWGAEATGLHDDLRREAERGRSDLKAVAASSSGSETYKAFTNGSQSNLTMASAARIDAALGMIIVSEAVNARKVSLQVVLAHQTLHHAGVPRAGRNADWYELARNFPTKLEDVEAWCRRDTEPRIQGFMAAYAAALRSPPPLPADLAARGRSGADPEEGATRGQSDAPREPLNAEREGAGKDKQHNDDPAPPGTLVGWLRGRADQAGYLSRFGVEGRWERQTKAELTRICQGIRVALTPSHPHRHLAFFGTVSLATSLPARRASELKTQRNTDIWLDPQLGAVRWFLQRLLNAERAATLAPHEIEDADLVEIWLPELAVAVGRELASLRPDAGDMLQLLTGATSPEAREAFLAEYRDWLRTLGYDSRHDVEDARFGRSLGQFFRDQAGDVVAAFLGLDLEEVAIGTLHYVRLERSFLHGQCDLVWQRVGLGPAAPMTLPDLAIGSRQALTESEFETAICAFQRRSEAAVQALLSAATTAELIKAWQALVELRILGTIELSGARGDRLSRLTWGTVYAHALYIVLRDKDTSDYAKTRMVPIVTMLRTVLDEHVRDLREFCRRAEKLGLRVTTPTGRHFADRAPHRVCFYAALTVEHPDGAYLARAAIDRSAVEKLGREVFDRELNVGRHTLTTMGVKHGYEPALIKVLSGHVRGLAEPFSDGQCISPETAIRMLADALKWSLRNISPVVQKPVEPGILTVAEFTSRLPVSKAIPTRPAFSRSRVLPEPFTLDTAVAIRIIDHLRCRLASGEWPTDPDARLLATLMLIQWVSLADAQRAWTSAGSIQHLTARSTALVMQREGCRTEIRRPLVGPAALAAQNTDSSKTRKPWPEVLALLGSWLESQLPTTPWPSDPTACSEALDTLMKLWLRVFVPPFLLTCESSLIAAPTATRQSLLRLIADPDKSIDDREVLVFPKPQSRGRGTVRIRPSPLKDAIGKVRDFSDEAKHVGENWARMGDVAKAMQAIDTSQFLPAETYTNYVIAEAGKWSGSQGGRIKISSVDTYTSNISSSLAQLRSDDNMREWYEEWFDFFAFLRATAPGDTPEEKKAAGVTRTTAAARFVRTLAEIGYSIPQALLDEPVVRGLDGMRRSAASTLLLQSDRDRVTRLMAGHFAEDPLWSRLAVLYCELRWHFAFRSIEVAVLPLDAIDEFMCLVVTTDGFAHLKSKHSRRLAPVIQAVVDQFHSAATVVARARPGASWLFLMDDRSDWSFIEDLEDAFGAALKQVTGEREARQHAARAVLPLDVLFPGWEPLLRRFLNGQASTEECVHFCTDLSRQGFGAMVAVLLWTGHGHPLTYLRHYLAIWDLLLAIFAQASLTTIAADPASAARAYGATASASLRQTKMRSRDAGVAMDAWAWMTGYVPARSCLPRVEMEEPSRQSLRVRPRAPSSSPVVTPPARQMLYLALRMTMKDQEQDAAAHGAQIPTWVAARLETIFVAEHLGAARQRHQMPDSARGRGAEVNYLLNDDGLKLAQSLAESSPATVQQLALALTPMRAGDYVLPSIEAFRATVVKFAACLPASLGVLAQFSEGRLESADRARLNDVRARIFTGADDRDLGERPRLSVVAADSPLNLVLRARRTANARALLAALQLIRSN